MKVIEDIGFLVAVLVALLYGSAEALHRIGFNLTDKAADHSFPWGLLIVLATLALPKVLGKATAGRIWDAIAQRLGGRGSTP